MCLQQLPLQPPGAAPRYGAAQGVRAQAQRGRGFLISCVLAHPWDGTHLHCDAAARPKHHL